MRRSNKRLFDAVLFVLGFAVTVALFNVVLLHGATSRMLATSLLTWLPPGGQSPGPRGSPDSEHCLR